MIQILKPDGRTLSYAKIGWNDATNALVRNEVSALAALKKLHRNFAVPEILHADEWSGRYFCIVSAPEGRTTSAPPRIAEVYLDAISQLAVSSTCLLPLGQSAFWQRHLKRLAATPDCRYRRLLVEATAWIERRIDGRPVSFHASHGDLGPWNACCVDGKLFLYDWEFADLEAPAGSDLFHLMIQSRWYRPGDSPYEVYQSLRSDECGSHSFRAYMNTACMERETWIPLLALYLVGKFSELASAGQTGFGRLRLLETLIQLCMHDLSAGR